MSDEKETNIQQIKEKIMNTFNNKNQFYDLTELLNLNIREMKKEDLNDFSDWLYKEIESKIYLTNMKVRVIKIIR